MGASLSVKRCPRFQTRPAVHMRSRRVEPAGAVGSGVLRKRVFHASVKHSTGAAGCPGVRAPDGGSRLLTSNGLRMKLLEEPVSVVFETAPSRRTEAGAWPFAGLITGNWV